MMTLSCRHSVVLVSLIAATACSRHTTSQPNPQDPIASIGVSELPVASLAGGGALLFPVGSIVFGDSVSELALRRGDLLDRATAVLDSVLIRDARAVTWHDQEAIRRALRRAPSLVTADPTRLPTGFLLARKVEVVPDPLWSSLRALAALTGARMAVIPVAVKLDGREGAVGASYVIAIVDTRLGQMVWRGRVVGPSSATAEAALLAAAAAAVPSGIR
jgi:hypothetical protein